MMWWGKLLGGVFGYVVGDFIGAIIGIFIGHQLDRVINSTRIGGAGPQEKTQAAFFETTFSVMGHISKSDGLVSPEEIQLAEQVMKQMQLSKEQRISAINYFNQGKQEEFNLDAALHEFRQTCGRKTALLQMFVEIQLQAVYADGIKNPSEEKILRHICSVLGYPAILLTQLESMLFASQRSRQSYSSNNSYANSTSALMDAYKIIGVSDTATDAEVKKAYRRLMNQHHPDKLISKGLPEEMIEIATNKTQEIQKAYDLISESRK